MDQYDYLTREQLLSLLRALGEDRAAARSSVSAGADGLSEFGKRALREFESSSSPMRIFEHETLKHLAVNDAAVKFYGYSREEFLALTLKDTRHPDEHAAQLASLNEAAGYLRYGKPRRQLKKSGEIVVVEVVIQDILFNGRKARLTLTMDITERKRTEQALRETNEFLRSVIESSRDCIKVLDLEGRLQLMNDGGRCLLEIDDLAPLLNTEWLKFWRGTDHAAARAALEAARRGGVGSFEGHCPTWKGTPRWWDVLVTPIFDADGKPASLLAVSRDITVRKQAELAAHRSAELARLLESLARATNEAVTPEAAMVACLERICEHGRWALGRVRLLERGRPEDTPGRSIWHAPERERFAGFIRLSSDRILGVSGPFTGRVLRERTAVWIEDLQKATKFGRREAAARHGLRSAFAFPIIVRGDVVAIMEVFSEETRAQDPHTMGAAQSLASQLARIVEREWAHEVDAKLAAIVESSRDAIISRALDGTILTWNVGAERLFGYTAAEIVGRNLEILYPPERKPEMFKRQRLVLKGEGLPTLETVRIAKDGRRVQVSLSSAPIRDSSGEAWGISTIMRDISERKLAEQALRESEERFRHLAENIEHMFWINTLAGDRIIYVSPAYEQIWGRSRESLYRNPRSWMEPIHPDDLPAVRDSQARMARGEHTDVEYRIIRPDGTIRWIKDRSYDMKQGDGDPLVCGIAEDITAQRQAEQERLTHAIHQRDALVREVHHRIKNNLQGVIGLLRRKIRKFPAVAPSIEEAIVQLQTVAVVYGLQGTRTDGLLGLAEMVEAICASTEGLIGGHVDRVFERESQRPVCVAGSEAVSMAVALNELVFNALKHQPAPSSRKRAQVVLCEARNAAEIRITNHGRLPRAFDFSAGRAVGNGLELVRALLDSPGASIKFNHGRNKVEVVVRLSPPLLAARQASIERGGEHGGAVDKKAATVHTGRG